MPNKSKTPNNDKAKLTYTHKAVVVSAAIVLIITMYAVAFFFLRGSGSIQTSTVTNDRQNIKINVTGYVVRDETHVSQPEKNKQSPLIESGKNNTVGMIIKDGDYVSYNQEIARIFDSKEEYSNWQKFTEIEDELEVLSRLHEYSSNSSDLDSINLEITALLRQYVDDVQSGRLTEDFSDLLQSLAYQIGTINPNKKIESAIASLNDKLSAYRSMFNFTNAIKSPSAGYFSNQVDSLESSADYNEISDNGLSVKDLKKLLKKKPNVDDRYLGKIVYQNNWYFSFIAEEGFAGEYLKRGSYIKVSFPNRGISDVTMVVSRKRKDGDKVCVTCRCSLVSPELLKLRIEDAIISAKDIKGFKISNNSIISVDGITGVYTVVANRSIFKPISIIYGSSDYSVCRELSCTEFIDLYGEDKLINLISDITKEHYKFELNSDDTDKLTLFGRMYQYDNRILTDYDITIVKGRNLYDGKFIT